MHQCTISMELGHKAGTSREGVKSWCITGSEHCSCTLRLFNIFRQLKMSTNEYSVAQGPKFTAHTYSEQVWGMHEKQLADLFKALFTQPVQ